MIETNVWYKVTCIWNVYDPWDKPKLAFVEGEYYRGCKYENGEWEVHSDISATNHCLYFTAEEFEQCFEVGERLF